MVFRTRYPGLVWAMALCLVVLAVPSHAQDSVTIEKKLKQVEALVPAWVQADGDAQQIRSLGDQVQKHLQAGQLQKADQVLDQMLALLGGGSETPEPLNKRLERKGKEIEARMPTWLAEGGKPADIQPLGARLEQLLKSRQQDQAEKVMDEMLAILNRGRSSKRPERNIIARLRVYDQNGKPVPKRELTPRGVGLVVTGIYLLDVNYNPVPGGIASIDDGVVSLNESAPSPFIVHFLPQVEGFGRVKLLVDNGGKGYRWPATTSTELDLPLEAARSRLAKTREILARAEPSIFRPATLARLKSGEQYLHEAVSTGVVAPQTLYRSLKEALWAGEMATLDEARELIRERGLRNGFRFGIFTEGYEDWGTAEEARVKAVFNYATILDFFIRSYEDQGGKPQPEKVDRALAWVERLGLEPKGHPLVYLLPPNVPPRLEKASFTGVRDAMLARSSREVTRYRSRIKLWDVVNEPNFCNARYSQEEMVELTRMTLQRVKETDPSAVRILNVNQPLGEYVVVPELQRIATKPRTGTLQTTHQFVASLLRAGIDFEVIGLELYYPGLDMMELSRLLDRYAALGKPVHVTELAISSAPGVDKRSQHFQEPEFLEALGEWHGPWSEAMQADWVEQFYTIAYSKPTVEAITWTHLVDSFWPFGGLVRRDLTPKESFARLQTLLQSWGQPRPRKGAPRS